MATKKAPAKSKSITGLRLRSKFFNLSRPAQALVFMVIFAGLAGGSYLLGFGRAATNITYDVNYCRNSPTWRITQRGDHGGCVSTLQSVLKYDNGSRNVCNSNSMAVDGDFGPITQSKVKCFQGVYGLSKDGIVGPKTWSMVYSVCVRLASSTSGYNMGICRNV
jgi:hypothetical protein